MLTTLAVTVLVDLMAAVAVGVVMASLLFVSKMAEAQMESVRFSFGSGAAPDLDAEEGAILDEAGGRIVLFQVAGPLSFASIRDITRLMHGSPDQEVLVIDLSSVPFIDSSTAMALEEAGESLAANGDRLVIAGACPRVREKLACTDVLSLAGPGNDVADRRTGLRAARALLAPSLTAEMSRA